jgi:hypothetical protein
MTTKYLPIAFGFIVLAIGCYWFQIRPTQIRQYSNNPSSALSTVLANRGETISADRIQEALKNNGVNSETQNNWYGECLDVKGFKPEDLK